MVASPFLQRLNRNLLCGARDCCSCISLCVLARYCFLNISDLDRTFNFLGYLHASRFLICPIGCSPQVATELRKHRMLCNIKVSLKYYLFYISSNSILWGISAGIFSIWMEAYVSKTLYGIAKRQRYHQLQKIQVCIPT